MNPLDRRILQLVESICAKPVRSWVNLNDLERELDANNHKIGKALTRLVDDGYIERREGSTGRYHAYRPVDDPDQSDLGAFEGASP